MFLLHLRSADMLSFYTVKIWTWTTGDAILVAMNGMAERQIGLSFRLKAHLKVGNEYTLNDVANLLGVQTNALTRRGVFRTSGADCFVIFINLQKKDDATPYQDHLFEPSALLFWEGQTTMRMAEDSFDRGLDCHVFIHNVTKTPYTYYGRAVPIRQHRNPPGKPSRFVLYLPEYAEYTNTGIKISEEISEVEKMLIPASGPTESETFQKIRTRQSEYRKNVIKLWHGQCAVTGVDETSWLIASHIKPWRESTDKERIDPRNSLLLSPNYDKLFDRGVISFNPSNGRIILPESMSAAFWRNLDRLGISDEKELAFVPEGTDKYLEYHRQMVFGYTPTTDFDATKFVADLLPIA